MDTITQIRCTRCGELKDISEMGKDKSRKRGIGSWCKKCVNEKTKARYAQNAEQLREKARVYYWEHLDEMRTKSRIYWKSHPEQFAAYKAKHREKNCQDLRQRRVDARGLVIQHYGGKCVFCGDRNIYHLCIDHINGGGTKHRKELKKTNIYQWIIWHNYPDGFQVLCHTHNLEKGFYGTMTPAVFDDELNKR